VFTFEQSTVQLHGLSQSMLDSNQNINKGSNLSSSKNTEK